MSGYREKGCRCALRAEAAGMKTVPGLPTMSLVKKVVFLVALLFVTWCWGNRADR